VKADTSDGSFCLVDFALTATVHPKQSLGEGDAVCVGGDDRFPLVRNADRNDLQSPLGTQSIECFSRRRAKASPPVFRILLVTVASDALEGEASSRAAQLLSLAVEDDAAGGRRTGVHRNEEGIGIGRGTQFYFFGEERSALLALRDSASPRPSCTRARQGLHCYQVSEANYLTPAGAKKIQDELKLLAGVERPKVVREVADAAAQGDRSENAEYIYGKKRLREIDRRIRFLTKRLDCAVIVDPKSLGHAEIRFGATVVVRDEDEVEKTYTLVGPDESDPAAGRLSYKSPIGRALMKKREGDVVVVHRPLGELELEVISITYGELTDIEGNEEISE
jgi:transcription elongation factor GreB